MKVEINSVFNLNLTVETGSATLLASNLCCSGCPEGLYHYMISVIILTCGGGASVVLPLKDQRLVPTT